MNAARRLRRTGRASGGFTLFELLVVMVIIGLMSALVMPRMTASLPGVRLRSSTRAVAASLRYARSQAVSESIPYIAVFDRDRKRLVVEPVPAAPAAAESGAAGGIPETAGAQNVFALPEGIAFGPLKTPAGDQPDAFAIHFFPQGDSTGGRIVLENPNRRQTAVTVDAITGSVQIDG